MINIYTDSDFTVSRKRRNKLLAVFFTVLAVYLAANAVVYAFFLLEPYNTPKKPLLLALHGVLAAAFFLFVFIFMGIKFKRVKNYNKTLYYIKNGIKEEYEGEFLRFSEEDELKDGNEFDCMIMREWNHYKQDYFERKVLLDKNKPRPDFKENQKIKFITQGNVLVEYETEDN